MNGGTPRALAAWDDALDLLHAHGWRLVPAYFLACLPFAVTALLTLDAVFAGDRADLPILCLGLVATGYLRWFGGALLQRRATQALDGDAGPALSAFLPAYFWTRLRRQALLAGPAAMDGGSAGEALANAKRVRRSLAGYFRRLRAVGTLFWLMGFLQLLVVQYFLVDMLLPFLFGYDDPLLAAVLFSRFWLTALLLFSCLCLECVWLTAGVIAYRRGAARWTGADLAARIRAAEGAK